MSSFISACGLEVKVEKDFFINVAARLEKAYTEKSALVFKTHYHIWVSMSDYLGRVISETHLQSNIEILKRQISHYKPLLLARR